MSIEVKVPSPGESISEVQLATWLVKDGEYVEKDAEIAEIDSDKATLTINAPEAGSIHLLVEAGETIKVGEVVAKIDTSAAPAALSPSPKQESEKKQTEKPQEKEQARDTEPVAEKPNALAEGKLNVTPLARKVMQEMNVNENDIFDYIRHIRIEKADIAEVAGSKSSASGSQAPAAVPAWGGTRNSERKKMSTLRQKLSQRLVAVKNETAMLTTFNEVNMSRIMEMRRKYNDRFKETYGVSLGFMSLFTKAITIALGHYPQVNAMIDGDEMVYYDYADIGIAVSAPKGLVVPVVRNAESLSLAEIEKKIKELAIKARDNKITIDDMTGGTFTITNGGVFGSMMSTPIINPPQSAILGMHNIIERPVALDGQVVIAPMMYVALSYDHRVIDGRESVGFLVKVKELLENPEKMLFNGQDPMETLLGF